MKDKLPDQEMALLLEELKDKGCELLSLDFISEAQKITILDNARLIILGD